MTRWQRFKHALGFHDWVYTDKTDSFGRTHYYLRRCWRCPLVQKFLAVPAAPGAFTTWVDIDDY